MKKFLFMLVFSCLMLPACGSKEPKQYSISDGPFRPINSPEFYTQEQMQTAKREYNRLRRNNSVIADNNNVISRPHSQRGSKLVANSAKEPESVPVPEPSLQLELVSPSAASLESGMTRTVTVAVRQNGRPVPGASVQFDRSPAYPNLRTIVRRANGEGQITLSGLWIEDISTPLTATVNGERLQLYLTSPSTASLAPALASLSDDVSSRPVPLATPALVPPTAPLVSPAPEPVLIPAPPPAVVDSPPPAPALIAVPHIPLPVAIEESWDVFPGLLREQLAQWAARAGYQLIWKASSDYDIFAAATFRGSFITAVEELFTRLHVHGNPLRVAIFESNQVIEVNED